MSDNEITVKVLTDVDTAPVDALEEQIESEHTFNVESSDIDEAESKAEELDSEIESEHTLPVDSSDLDEAQDKVDNLTDSMDAMAMLTAAEALGGYGEQAEGLAQGMNEASISVGQLATQTGVAEPQMRSLVATISNATFPQEEAMMYVKSLDQIGVSSGNLGKSATDLDKINDAFGLGAGTVNSLGQELSVLGVDMNNVSSSFNALAYANANTVGGMENYYSFLRKYDAQFKELGYNVDQSSLIIAAATQKYGGGRAALTGLSDALKEANGDSRALEQALGMQAGSLDNASQITGEYEGQLQALADEEAEHKTWLDQISAAWEDVTMAMSPVLAPLTSFMGLIGQAGSFAVGINGLVTLAKSMSALRDMELAATAASYAHTAAEVVQSGVTKAVAAAQWLLNAAMDANPIMLVVLAIIALIAVLGYLYFNNEQVRAAVDALGQTFMWIANTVISAVTSALQWLSDLFTNFTNQLGLDTTDWTQAILGFILFLPTLPMQLSVALANAIAHLLGFKGNFVQSMTSAASQAVNNFVSWISQLPGKLKGELDRMIQDALDFASRLPEIIGQAAVNMVGSWVGGSEEHSPGAMWKAYTGELKAMEEAPSDYNIAGNMGSVASDMVSNFNPNLASSGASMVGGTNNITINIDSVDNKERIDEIVKAVEDALAFDNLTAGRTV